MRWMQIKSGQKLHLVYEPGEGPDAEHLIPAGYLSAPICGRGLDEHGGFRMTINAPLGHACKRCLRVYAARHLTPRAADAATPRASAGDGDSGSPASTQDGGEPRR